MTGSAFTGQFATSFPRLYLFGPHDVRSQTGSSIRRTGTRWLPTLRRRKTRAYRLAGGSFWVPTGTTRAVGRGSLECVGTLTERTRGARARQSSLLLTDFEGVAR